MVKQLSKDKRWKIYDNLSKDLQSAIFSEDTADAIWNICKLCDINQVAIVAKQVGNVLMGLLSPEELKRVLQKQLKLDGSIANKLEANIQHYIFNPVIDDLMAIYHPEKLAEAEKEFEKTEKKRKKTKDVYREPIG